MAPSPLSKLSQLPPWCSTPTPPPRTTPGPPPGQPRHQLPCSDQSQLYQLCQLLQLCTQLFQQYLQFQLYQLFQQCQLQLWPQSGTLRLSSM